ncbi:MAG: hypothetical protein Q9187_008694 [Circinaria calcarea]
MESKAVNGAEGGCKASLFPLSLIPSGLELVKMRQLVSFWFLLACTGSVWAVLFTSDFSVLQTRAPVNISRRGPTALQRAYAKYGIRSVLHLTPRGQQGSVINQPHNFAGFDNYPDDEYIATIGIGTPCQTLLVDLDTGSADFWVYSSETPLEDGRSNHSYYDPSKSTTSRKLAGYNYSITYGDGSFSSGDVYTDVVDFGGVKFATQSVEAAKIVSPDFLPDPYFDGYFGLGHDGGNQIKPNAQKTFFTNVAPSLTSPLFTASLNHLNAGVYDFGFIDPRKYSGPLRFFPSPAPPAGHGWWVVNATGYSVGSTKTLTSFVGGLLAIIDTGNTFLLLPQQYCDSYYAQASSVVNDPDYGYIYPCKAALPDLTIAIGDYQARIPGSLLQGANLNSTTCFTGLHSIPQAPNIPNAVFGDTFLKTTFTVFKYPPGGSASLGFATKPSGSSYVS